MKEVGLNACTRLLEGTLAPYSMHLPVSSLVIRRCPRRVQIPSSHLFAPGKRVNTRQSTPRAPQRNLRPLAMTRENTEETMRWREETLEGVQEP